MCVPSGLSFHLESFHCLIPVESILYGTGKHMVDTGMSVSRRRSFEEHELRASLSLVYCLMKHVIIIPLLKYLFIHLSQVQSIMFGKFLGHCFYLV